MRRLGEYDLPGRFGPAAPRLLIEVLTATGCVGLAAVLRLVVETVLPHTAPFALGFPAVLLATVLAGWRAGALTLASVVAGVWYLVLPPRFAFGPLTSDDAANLVLNAISGALVVAVAEGFRSASRRAQAERAAKIESRDLMLRELNHRTKNNFQMVAGLLEMERRAATEPAAARALEGVVTRVHNLAQAHAALYVPSGEVETIDFARYLEDLCRSLSESLLLNTVVHLSCASEPAPMATDRAAALGVVINELVTNAAKHAFPDGRSGTIRVAFGRSGEGWRLTVSDDGVGLAASAAAPGGLGRRLVEAFARQAGGALSQGEGPGAVFGVDLPG